MNKRRLALTIALTCVGLLLLGSFTAPERLSPVSGAEYALPMEAPPFGADARGRSLLGYALQGAQIVAGPAFLAAVLVGLLATLGGLLRCAGSERLVTLVNGFREVVGALPRMVVILVVALLTPPEWRGLGVLAVFWAILAAPGAIDEASAVASRIGGANFVEALRAHGFTRPRIYLYHIVALNLRPVIVRHASETLMQVVFLEVALSYLALASDEPSFTHLESFHSWADLLYMGYTSLILDVPTMHALLLGLGLVGVTAVLSVSVTASARAR